MRFTESERNWSQDNTDAYRHQTLKQSLLVAAVAQSFSGWFSAAECTRLFVKEIGSVCYRTIRRYLRTFEMLGLIEIRRASGCTGLRYEYRWLGWPMPIVD